MNGKDYSITAIIPIFNGENYIVEAVRSVLSQTVMPDEIILIDDGSTDNSMRNVRDAFPDAALTVLTKPNGGQSAARNLGVAHAKGALIAFLDQDDAWYPQHLEALRAPFMEARAQPLGWTYSDLDEIEAGGSITARRFLRTLDTEHPKRDVYACLRENMFVLPSASLIARDAFQAVGGFDERLSGYEDDDLFLRLFRAGYDNSFLEEALSQWRVYPASYSYSPRMARSRMIYARKLIDTFPDDPKRERFCVRDLILPRFYPEIAGECRKAIASGNEAAIRVAREDLAYISAFLAGSRAAAELPASSLLISGIIPLYNGAPYIETAIRSVFAQTVPVTELIVVDDGSTDEGPAIVERLAKELPLRLLRKPNGGQSSARNHGVAHCHGDYIALLDQDDSWYPNHIEKLVQPFLAPRARKLGWVYSNLDEMDEEGRTIVTSFLSSLGTQHPKQDIFACLREDLFILPSASLILREAFDAIGGFDERLSGYEDDDLFLRLFRAGYDNVYLDEPLSRWRIYPSSSSYSPRMARSRAIYARKLLADFPDDASRSRFYCRDLIVPRFYPQMLAEYVKAARLGDHELVAGARQHLAMFRPWLGLRQRLVLAVLRSPAIELRPVPALVTAAARALRPGPRTPRNRPGSGKALAS